MKKVVASLLCVLACSSHAQGNTGSWSYNMMSDNEGVYAGTVNESGALFGRYCTFSNDSCMFLLGVDSRCNKDEVYTILINSPPGAVPVSGVCLGTYGNSYKIMLSPFTSIENSMANSGQIGFAIPLASGSFKAVRFDLSGAMTAVELSKNLYNVKKRSSTKDMTL